MAVEAALTALERASAESRDPTVRVQFRARRVRVWLPFRPYGRAFEGELEPLDGETVVRGRFKIGALPRLQLAFVVAWSVAFVGISAYVLVVLAGRAGLSAGALALVVIAPMALILAIALMIRGVAEGSEAQVRYLLDHLSGRPATRPPRGPSFGYAPLGAGAFAILLVLNLIDIATSGGLRIPIVALAVVLEFTWFFWYRRLRNAGIKH
jgi:hypothetical protein